MDPLAPVSAWTLEDDYEWLKDAFQEASTSFESLNKGAVHFSPRFSFQEPGDPWDSLTYDANASVEPSPQNMECLNSSHVLEYDGDKSGHKRKVNDNATDIDDPMLKRIRNSVVENGDNTHSTDYVHEQEKENHFASKVSNSESLHQQFPYFETDSDAAAFTSLTESWEFDEAGHFCLEAETLVKFDDTSLIYGDIDVGNIGDSFTLGQIPTENTNESILELTLPAQVEEKESAANLADFLSAGDANNSEFMDFDHSDAMDEIPCHNMEHFVPTTDGNLAAGSSASVMDLSELEELLFTDIDGNDTANNPNLDSFLLDFTSDENITDVVKFSSTSGGCACTRDDINNGQVMNCCSESAILRSTAAANPELPPCLSDINILPSAPVANNSELHIASPPEAQILSSKPKDDPSCGLLNTQDTEIPCNDDADFTRSFRRNRRVWRRLSSTNKYRQLRGIKNYYLAQEKPHSSSTIHSKKEVFKGDNIRESPEESLDWSGTIQSDILSELGINLPFMRRGD